MGLVRWAEIGKGERDGDGKRYFCGGVARGIGDVGQGFSFGGTGGEVDDPLGGWGDGGVHSQRRCVLFGMGREVMVVRWSGI